GGRVGGGGGGRGRGPPSPAGGGGGGGGRSTARRPLSAALSASGARRADATNHPTRAWRNGRRKGLKNTFVVGATSCPSARILMQFQNDGSPVSDSGKSSKITPGAN